MQRRTSISGVFEKILVGRWIAGERMIDAVRRAKDLDALHAGTLINYLGEDLAEKQEVADATFTYLQLLNEIKKSKLNAGISLKPTQLGLKVSRTLAVRNLEKIANRARKLGIFVWLDMESPGTIDDTIFIYESQVRKKGIGMTLQARLKRSEKDLKRLLRKRAVVRLVKGAYGGTARYAFETKEKTDQNFAAMMRLLFKGSKEFSIATHDKKMIEEALSLNRVYRRKVTIAMLNGVKRKYSEGLSMSGNRVAIYVPFGSKWLDYSFRRFAELDKALLFLSR
jgi:proline dehydrogenase